MEHRTLLALALALAALPPAAAGQAGEGDAGPSGPGVVGRVVDRETRIPLDGVAVTLRPAGEGSDTLERPAPVLTDGEGRFAFGTLADGLYTLTIERIGYQEVADTVAFLGNMGLRIDVEMAAEALELEPLLVVTEARSRNLATAGFYDRRDRGIGRFVSRDDIVARAPLRASDLFRMMPGVRMSSTGRFGEEGVVLLRGGCVADVYLDGVRTTAPFPVDALVGATDLDGVEIYQGSEVPARFGPTDCGVVILWTHIPNPGSGKPFSWKKFLAALGFLGLSAFLLN